MLNRFRDKELLSGLLLAALGVFEFAVSLQYDTGTMNRMGPGYFPKLLAVGLVIVGAMLIAGSIGKAVSPIRDVNWRALLFFTAAFVAFGVLLNVAGLIVAAAVLVALSAFGGRDVRPLEVLAMVIGFTAAAVLIFVVGLGLSMPLHPWRG